MNTAVAELARGPGPSEDEDATDYWLAMIPGEGRLPMMATPRPTRPQGWRVELPAAGESLSRSVRSSVNLRTAGGLTARTRRGRLCSSGRPTVFAKPGAGSPATKATAGSPGAHCAGRAVQVEHPVLSGAPGGSAGNGPQRPREEQRQHDEPGAIPRLADAIQLSPTDSPNLKSQHAATGRDIQPRHLVSPHGDSPRLGYLLRSGAPARCRSLLPSTGFTGPAAPARPPRSQETRDRD